MCFAAVFVWLTGLSAYTGFRDSPRRENHYLATRPVKRHEVYLAKSLHVFLLSLIPVFGQLVISKGLNLDFPLLKHTMVVVLWGQCSLFAGAFIRLTSAHAVKWCVFGVAVIVALYAYRFLRQWMDLRSEDLGLMTFLVTTLIALVLMFWLTLKNVQRLTLWGGIVGGAALGLMLLISTTTQKDDAPLSESALQEALAERPKICTELEGQSGRKMKIALKFQRCAIGSPRILNFGLRDLVITNSRGETLDLSGKTTEYFYGKWRGYGGDSVIPFTAFVDEEVAEQLMRRSGYAHERTHEMASVVVEIPESFAVADQEITVSYTPYVRLKELEYLGEMPFRKGATFKGSSFMVSLRSNILRESETGYGERQCDFAFHWASADKEDVHLVYSESSGTSSWISRVRPYSEVEFTGHSIAQRWGVHFGDARVPLKDIKAYPEGAKLDIFRMNQRGSASLPRVSETTTPSQLFGGVRKAIQTPYYTLRSTTQPALEEVPQLQGDDVGVYLKKLQRLHYSEISNNAVIQSTLARLARDSSEELLSYFRLPVRSTRVSEFIIRSLADHAPDSIKEETLRLLSDEPLLIELVMKRGWGDEAKEQILDLAPVILRTNNYLIRKALLYYNDETSLDLLLQDLERNQSLEAYLALLASEKHQVRAKEIYKEKEAEVLNKLKSMRNLGDLSQSEAIFYLRTGSVAVLQEFCKICTRQGGVIGGSETWVMNESLLWSDYVRPKHSSEEAKAVCEVVKSTPENQFIYDADRRRIILPKPSNLK